MKYIETLRTFLNTPLDSGDAIFERFAALPGAISHRGTGPLQRYVYLPGTRKDRVVLVAHMDTVWDKAYGRPCPGEQTAVLENGVFRGTVSGCGIGADCRAGCALLWQLRDCGHSILLVDGEEHGKRGAKYLKKSNPKLFRELNRHCYMMEFDYSGTDCCLFNQVDNTRAFKRYMEQALGFADAKGKGGCDLQILCRHICGANLGIGFHCCHTEREVLVCSEWENTLKKLGAFLEQPQKRFPSLLLPYYVRLGKAALRKILKGKKVR